ncbi:uncharacterized protein LOC131176672, partial [Hevea brasiliensis]|uniref:uncharacterized protein LOC131176672 n=1 Tax=Hevea brasiliensis TaxID=3981 RepID=UPI0025DBE7C2
MDLVLEKQLWVQRFRGEVLSIESKLACIMSQLRSNSDTWSANNVTSLQNASSHSVSLVHWYPPGKGWIRLHTDGASGGNPGKAGGGGVFGDHLGLWLSGFFRMSLVNQYRQFLLRSWEIKLPHCFREANSVADRLANIAVNGNGDLLVLQ